MKSLNSEENFTKKVPYGIRIATYGINAYGPYGIRIEFYEHPGEIQKL